MSSERLVRMVSQLAQEKRRVPPMWSRKILPMVPVRATDWTLVFLFVPGDAASFCTQQDATELETTAGNVEAALEILEKKDSLQRALDRFTEREDFAVALQSTPLFLDTAKGSEESDFENLDQIALQLLENMLPVTGEAPVKDPAAALCHAESRYLRTQQNSPRDTTEASDSSLTDPVMGTEMVCEDRDPSPTTPTSVHALRPGDVKVVAAVGDSLTAGNGVGAKSGNLLLVMTEYRGLSWSIGGDANLANVTTLPNILKEFNSNVTGFSEGVGDENTPQAFFNQAVAGAKSRNMVAQRDWKVITMFVGGNDMCDFCMDTVPRALVNLVELLHIVPLRELHQEKSLKCPTFMTKIICPCVLSPIEGTREFQMLEDQNRAYQRGMRELVDSGRYDTHENFTVVLQPFFREVILPRLQDGRPDRSYFAPDCFHLSQKTHTLMAVALWNNMIEPVGNKTYSQNISAAVDMKCPSKKTPFLRTAQNSGYVYPDPRPTPPPVTNWGQDFNCTNTDPSDSVPTSGENA
ncbi:hypothetical protein CRUP_015007, partial [Coryphaenoides rupestris]